AGPHLLDKAVPSPGAGEPEIFCDPRNGLSSGDADAHAKVTLKGASGPTVDVEVTTCVALPQDRWQIMGTAGGLRGTANELQWRRGGWGTLPGRPVGQGPTPPPHATPGAPPWPGEARPRPARGASAHH